MKPRALVKSVCKKHGLIYKELADRCGVSLRTVQGWAIGRKPSGPAQKILDQLSK